MAESTARRRTTRSTGRYGNTVKKSVTLRGTVVDEIEARIGPGGFSKFIDAAAESYLALLRAQEVMADRSRRQA